MGSPRITRHLRERGVRCGRHRVARLMRLNGWRARKKRPFRPKTTRPGKEPCANLLAQRPPPSAPNQVWVSDITYVATREGWLYLAVVLDLFSRKVIAWRLREHMQASLVADALGDALRRRQPGPGLIFHSDRGSQYGSHCVRKPLEAVGALQSMSALGYCYDNAFAEALFSTYKTECLPDGGVFETKREARRRTFEYLEAYYNSRRLHSSLCYMTPDAFEWRLLSRSESSLDARNKRANMPSARREDKAPRGRNLSACRASNTAGSAALEPPAGPARRIEPKAINPRGSGGQSPPVSNLN